MHSILLLITLLLILPTRTAFAESRETIARLLDLKQAMVTIRARTFDSSDKKHAAVALDPASGRIVTVQGKRLRYIEQTGAGVIIDPTGLIVTNTHIIFGSHEIVATLADGREFVARVVFVSPKDDFSLLAINTPTPLPAIEFADTAEPGESVTTIGHSDLLNDTISGGIISGIGTRMTDHGPEVELLKLNINHYSGDSGAPVFDQAGKFLGLISAKRLSAQRELFAVPAGKIRFAYIHLDKASQSK